MKLLQIESDKCRHTLVDEAAQSTVPTVSKQNLMHNEPDTSNQWQNSQKQNLTKGRLQKKITGLFGNFSQHRGGGVSSIPKLL